MLSIQLLKLQRARHIKENTEPPATHALTIHTHPTAVVLCIRHCHLVLRPWSHPETAQQDVPN